MNKKLFVISGCSGVGKGTVLKEFMARNSKDFMLSVSCTTRKPRPGEVDGVNYFFLTPEDFQECIKKDKFLEYAQFAGNFYGTKQKYINQKFINNANISFIIGGSNGLEQNILDKCDDFISFSDFTFPHGLFRGILLEQIYRSFKINNNETYHK